MRKLPYPAALYGQQADVGCRIHAASGPAPPDDIPSRWAPIRILRSARLRGDILHASTLEVMSELELLQELLKHQELSQVHRPYRGT
jgi:hypothetical protein